MDEELITARQYAKRFGENIRTVQKLAEEGKVRDRRLIGPYYVAPVQAWKNAMQNRRKTRGRPRKDEAPGASD